MPDDGRPCRHRQLRHPQPRRINRFLEPCLMLLLHCNEAHGYELLEGLKPYGFARNPADSSTVYRVLRHLEEQGCVTSRWETGGAGPARRLYRITEEGDRFLAGWADNLRETDRVLHRFLRTYDTHMEIHR